MKISSMYRQWFALLAGGGKLAESNRNEFVLADISDSKAGRKNLPIDKIPLCGSNIDTDRKGVRIVVNNGWDVVTAYRLVADKIQEVWPTKKSQSRAGASNLLHPTEDLFWIGNQILAFSTGKQIGRAHV